MYNIATKNKLYLGFILVLTALTVALNFCNAIYQCALVFTLIGLVVNNIATKWNKQNALKGLLSAIIMGYAISYNLPYYIHGQLISLLALGSLISVLISMHVSTGLFVSLENKMSFAKANFLSIGVAAIIDAFAMSAFFLLNTNFALTRIASIGIQEVSYKLIYAALFSALISSIVYLANSLKANSGSRI